MKRRFLLLLALCFAAPAQAGLFSDDEARKQVQQLEERVIKLEDANRQQTRALLDLQGQIEALNTQLRELRGQNEELAHGLQDAEKREKDFYVDLDGRLRQLESANTGVAQPAPGGQAAASSDPDDPVAANRAYEAAYGLYKSGSHASAAKAFLEFIKKYPGSAYVPEAHYWIGNALFSLKDYQGALDTYQELLDAYPSTPRAADVLFNIAGCQQELKQGKEAQKTLKSLVSKYPSSDAAAKAKKLLAPKK